MNPQKRTPRPKAMIFQRSVQFSRMEWLAVKANVIGRRELCLGVKGLVVEKIESACQVDERVTCLLLVRDCGNAFGDDMPVQLAELVDETLVEPDAALMAPRRSALP